ncbi:hypothetical protein [Rahnella victoriana]|uniref:Uncharacterized protein n=1 Tax=Rahnella victoriana TaxID=1510570 RepID=A0ABS0DNQ1_9GAMM|nr:hypothetical protein [Rahnella victoriana]MBF7955519.1 hypothetical protein [Rahnella victoriana]
MTTFKTTELHHQLEINGYKEYRISPNVDTFNPDGSAFIIAADNNIICTYDTATKLWSFKDTRHSSLAVNQMSMNGKETTEADLGMVCITHGYGIQDHPAIGDND